MTVRERAKRPELIQPNIALLYRPPLSRRLEQAPLLAPKINSLRFQCPVIFLARHFRIRRWQSTVARASSPRTALILGPPRSTPKVRLPHD